MLFNSYIFIFLFLPLVLLGYYGLNHFKKYKAAIAFVFAMSLWFYGYNNRYYLIMLVVSIVLNHLLVGAMEKFAKWRKPLFGVAVLLNLGILFFFKYYDFFLENLNVALHTDLPFLRIALPLGISFYTFQQLSYVIDYYRGECERYSFLEYATYVSFFPQLIAGPIVYHTELIPQFRDMKNKKPDVENFCKGIYAFACGLGKKVLIADVFSPIVNTAFADLYSLNTTSLIVVAFCISFQIYFDFSGYSDMAYGIGYMFNIVLPVNFNSPYKATSISEFWNRWHMTLNRFFIKYVYIPLGGNRKGLVRTYINTLSVFLVSGLWHGAAWTYVCWGGINGVAVAINRAFKKWIDKIPKWIGLITTNLLFVFTVIIFRADTLGRAKLFFIKLFTTGFGPLAETLTSSFNDRVEVSMLSKFGLQDIVTTYPWICFSVYFLIVLVASITQKNTQEKVAELKYSYKKLFATAFMLIWSILSLSEVSEFLYYNF